MIEADVTVEDRDEDGTPSYAVKISSPLIELNVAIPRSDIQSLRRALSTEWSSGALCLGTCAGVPVFWCAAEQGMISVLVGYDDQTWDVCLTLPAEVIDMILNGLPRSPGVA